MIGFFVLKTWIIFIFLILVCLRCSEIHIKIWVSMEGIFIVQRISWLFLDGLNLVELIDLFGGGGWVIGVIGRKFRRTVEGRNLSVKLYLVVVLDSLIDESFCNLWMIGWGRDVRRRVLYGLERGRLILVEMGLNGVEILDHEFEMINFLYKLELKWCDFLQALVAVGWAFWNWVFFALRIVKTVVKWCLVMVWRRWLGERWSGSKMV